MCNSINRNCGYRERKGDMAESTKRCVACREVLPVSRFYPNPHNSDGLRGNCKRCRNRDRKRSVKARVRTLRATEATG